MGPNDPWLRAVRSALVAELSNLRGSWHDDGQLVVGPGTLAVRPEVTHDAESGHVDIGFHLNHGRTDAPVLWDCVAGGKGGPILGYGHGDATPLQKWFLDHPIMPRLRDTLAPALSSGLLHGVKVLLGAFGDASIAEVRVDGRRDDACSAALLALPWPKQPERVVVRFYVIFIHADDLGNGSSNR